ncbi:hypothetical protein F4808DRAFT_309921 [Astrocystis sublimbata]|nr:hypothetical protein F4808DRAFT_309921 [Astrocystis sublimbata]
MYPTTVTLLLAAITPLASAAGTWNLQWFYYPGCTSGDSHDNPTNSGSTSQDCQATKPFGGFLGGGPASLTLDTALAGDGAFCKIFLYRDSACADELEEYTAYSTDGNGSGASNVCLNVAAEHDAKDGIFSWKIFCTP